MHQIRFRLGLDLRVPTSKGKEGKGSGKEEKGREEEGRERKGVRGGEMEGEGVNIAWPDL